MVPTARASTINLRFALTWPEFLTLKSPPLIFGSAVLKSIVSMFVTGL